MLSHVDEEPIQAWLSSVSTCSRFLPAPSRTGKRKRPLADMSSNRVRKKPATPRKAAQIVLDEQENTPRAQTSFPPGLHNEPIQLSDDPCPQDSVSQASSQHSHSASATGSGYTVSTNGTKRKRDGSPVKQIIMMRHAEYRVQRQEWDRTALSLPDTGNLAKKMRGFGRNTGILAPSQATWQNQLGDGDEDERMFSEDRDQLGDVPGLEDSAHIWRHAARNWKRGSGEAHWNTSVQGPLLDEAWRRSRHRSRVRWDNITTASIEPLDLLVSGSIQKPVPGKKVDFCITLDIGDEVEGRLYRAGIWLNQTRYLGVFNNPIAVSIETKSPDDGATDAQVQLATWATAQVMKLRQLLTKAGTPNAAIPPLPLVLTQGHKWHFWTLRDLGVRDGAILYMDGIMFGDTVTHVGVYSVVAGIQLLMQWAEEVYRPWFERCVLKPILRVIA